MKKKLESEKTGLKMNELNTMYLWINRTQIAYSLMGEMQTRDKQLKYSEISSLTGEIISKYLVGAPM